VLRLGRISPLHGMTGLALNKKETVYVHDTNIEASRLETEAVQCLSRKGLSVRSDHPEQRFNETPVLLEPFRNHGLSPLRVTVECDAQLLAQQLGDRIQLVLSELRVIAHVKTVPGAAFLAVKAAGPPLNPLRFALPLAQRLQWRRARSPGTKGRARPALSEAQTAPLEGKKNSSAN